MTHPIDPSAPFEEFAQRILRAIEVEPAREVTRETSLPGDLGLDSIHVYELLLLIEASASLAEPPEEEPPLLTMGDAWQYFQRCWRATREPSRGRAPTA